MRFDVSAVQRIVDSATDYLLEHEDATVTEGIRIGMEVEIFLYGDGSRSPVGILGCSPLKVSVADHLKGKSGA